MASRLFPKTRSWFALGAPLELLSPISVLRVVYALGVLGWPIVALASSELLTLDGRCWSARSRWRWLGLGLVAVGPRDLFLPPLCQVLGALGLALLDMLIVAERGGTLALGFAAFFIPVVIADALFMQPRSVGGHVVLGGVGLVVSALGSGTTFAGTLGISVVVFVGAISALTTVILVPRQPARRHDRPPIPAS